MKTSTRVFDHKKALNQLKGLLEEETSCVKNIYTNPEKIEEQRKVMDVAIKKTGEEFSVLFIGAFSSGKSSMINALIGTELLPTGFLPETAVIGELHYGAEKEIWLYPKKGMWKGGDDPFQLASATPEEIEKYVSLSTDDAMNILEEEDGCETKIVSKFEKMVIYWPLDILKDGVVFVDSPGINDPYSNDVVVNAYLPQADAIVYVMDSQHAYQNTDIEQLTVINSIGFNNIITAYTFFDIVVKQYKNKDKLEHHCKTLINYMSKHSDLGPCAIHFLDSMEGLQAKMDDDVKALQHSGYEEFEKFLGDYLVEGKGRDQVRNMANTIVRQGDIMIKDAENLNNAADQDVEVLEKRRVDAENQLNIVRSNSFNTGRNYRNHLENYLPKAENMVRDFVKELPQKIDLEGFEPQTQLPDGARKLWPFGENGAKKRAKSIQEECTHELEKRMNVLYKQWFNTTISKYMKDAVTESTDAIRPDLMQIAKDLDDVTNTLSGSTGHGDGAETATNLAMGLAYAIVTGDWFTGGMSVIYGKGAMARGIAAQCGTGALLGILMVGGLPITLPVVVVAAIGASISTILLDNNKKKVEKIKKQVVKDLREYYASEKSKSDIEKMVSGIMKNINDYVEGACGDMEAALAQDIKATEDSIKQMIEESKLGQEDKRQQIEKRNLAVRRLTDIQKQTIEICGEYEITDVKAGAWTVA